MKPVSPTAAHRAFRDELIALLRRNDDRSALDGILDTKGRA